MGRAVRPIMTMWTTWILLALLLFWAVGAYNRLIRLRSAALQAFGSLDVQLLRWMALLADYQAARGAPEAEGMAPGRVDDAHAALAAAATQLGASLTVARTTPLDDGAAAALATAGQVLDTAWQTLVRETAQASQGMAPPALAPWIHRREQSALHVEQARHQFNTAVLQYNQGIAQFPASLLAWLFGMKKGRTL